MTEPTYSIKEIMELQFKGIDHKLDSISATLKDQTIQTEKRFAQMEAKLDEIEKEQALQKTEQAKYKVIWGIGATVGATIIAFGLNRIF